MVTDALAPMRVIKTLGGLVRKGGVIAAMSSSLGDVALNDRGEWEVYRARKAALNTLMRFARQATQAQVDEFHGDKGPDLQG